MIQQDTVNYSKNSIGTITGSSTQKMEVLSSLANKMNQRHFETHIQTIDDDFV